ncbi:MAG: 2-amino-4-hydroxy-6-hydroxymethyldihydropteridine diphosphokinase [Pseudomonadota bacterium]
MVNVYLGIGSNIDRENNIRGGLHVLAERFGKLLISPVYRCTSVGFDGEDFYNLVVSFITHKTIDEIIDETKKIEFNYGRKRNETRYSSRTLDIDLLLYGDVVDPKYDIPREDIQKYAFVLKPLLDIDESLVHPVTGESLSSIWASFSGDKSDLAIVEFSLE